MKIYKDIVQLSPEWWRLREKRMTASHATAIGNCGKGLETYVKEIMCEFFSKGERDSYTNKHMQRGLDLEDQAGMVYSFENNIPIQKVVFVTHNKYVGCSPDFFAGPDGLLEIKCPDDKGHFALLLGADTDTKYIWQCNCQMLICKKKWCDLVSYNPNYDESLIVRRVHPSKEHFEKLLKGFKLGEKMIKEIEQKMR